MSQGEHSSPVVISSAIERLELHRKYLSGRGRAHSETAAKHRVGLSDTFRAERAFSYIYIAGVLEAMFTTLDGALRTDLTVLNLDLHRLEIGTAMLLRASIWKGVTGPSTQERLDRRRSLIDAICGHHQIAPDIQVDVELDKIHDGKTVRPFHFDYLWDGLGLGWSGRKLWRSEDHKRRIQDLAQKRNAVAHFESDPLEIGSRVTFGELDSIVESVIETLSALEAGLSEWFAMSSQSNNVAGLT